MRKIRILIVDDSALMRQMLTAALSSDPEIEVVGAAPDPICARKMIKELNPDILTLDIEMPKMDGLTFLEKIMKLRPMPVIMVSSLTKKGAEVTMRALENGAVDFVAKPRALSGEGLKSFRSDLIPKIKTSMMAKVSNVKEIAPRISAQSCSMRRPSARIVAIGASTGGVVAVRTILSALSPECPAVLITQHMPAAFTKSFATRLNQYCSLQVKEAVDGEQIKPGHVYIAPGGRHLEVFGGKGSISCHLSDGPLVSGHQPSVDVLFQSVASNIGGDAIGIILTGMGRDGANGLLAMREAGASTFGQNQASCVVYGMPRAAYEMGAVSNELPLEQIAREISLVAKY